MLSAPLEVGRCHSQSECAQANELSPAIPDPVTRRETVAWIRAEFERNRHLTDVVRRPLSRTHTLSDPSPGAHRGSDQDNPSGIEVYSASLFQKIKVDACVLHICQRRVLSS